MLESTGSPNCAPPEPSSIEQVGSDDKFVRIGGIHALERVAVDAARRYDGSWMMDLRVLATLARELGDESTETAAPGPYRRRTTRLRSSTAVSSGVSRRRRTPVATSSSVRAVSMESAWRIRSTQSAALR